MKRIALFGSTGSIGHSTLRVASHLKNEVEIVALAAHSNIDLLEEQIHQVRPQMVAVANEEKARLLASRLPKDIQLFSGPEGLCELASSPEFDYVMMAIVGMGALPPTLAAIESGKEIGLASKEVLVSGGELVMRRVKEKGTRLIPVDSEHSAIAQCLVGEKKEEIARLILTASGGPFLHRSSESLASVTVNEALQHPNWKMGPKITVDSSNLMNKGLELIEARWLFDLPTDQIEIIIHPQSIIHSLVEFVDGSMKAQMNLPDMINPIQYALTYPKRKPGFLPPFDWSKVWQLDFSPPDRAHFPAIDFAYQSLELGGSAPCKLNAANEVFVERFLNREISWRGITDRLETLMKRHQSHKVESIEALLEVDHEARKEALSL